VTSHLHFGKPRSGLRPYIGLGAGAYYIKQRLEIGVMMLEVDNWHFGLMPEVGVLIPTESVIFIIRAKYNYAFSAGKSIGKDAIDISYVSLNVGVSVPAF
jgi:outer membrane protein W